MRAIGGTVAAELPQVLEWPALRFNTIVLGLTEPLALEELQGVARPLRPRLFHDREHFVAQIGLGEVEERLCGKRRVADEGLRTLAFIGDLFPYPFQGFVAPDKAIADRPNDIKRWLRAMARSLMFIRERPEEAADIAIKKIPMGNVTRPMVIEGIRRFARAIPEGVPGLPSPQGIKTLMEFDVKAPLKIKEDVSPEKVMNLKLMREVKEELESKR